MIIGVTHDQDGRLVQRLSASTKVSIGLPPNGNCNHPTRLDHFVFLRKRRPAFTPLAGTPRGSHLRRVEQGGSLPARPSR
jgi:hypothetical protein